MSVDLLEQVAGFRDSVLEKVSNRDIVSFKLSDVSFDDKANVKGNSLSSTSMNKILSSLRVKNNFITYKEKMQKDDWKQVEESLKSVNKNTEFWGKRVLNTDGSSTITKLFQRNESAIETDYSVGFKNYFDMITLALEGTKIEFELNDANFNDDTEEVTLRLLDKSTNIDALKDMSDLWKHGANLTFDLLQFNTAPFFERQICTNGMVASKMGFRTNIKNQSFNEDSIQKEINRILMNTDVKYAGMIQESVNHLKKTDLSIREYFEYKEFFENRNYDGRYNHILGKFFSDNEMYKAYGVELTKQTGKWLSSATSGRNAYDFFNDITWIASHKDITRIDSDDAYELQTRSSNLFFKDSFDLEDVAPKVNLKMGKVIVNNN